MDWNNLDEHTWYKAGYEALNAFRVPELLEPMSLYDVELPPSSFAGFGYGTANRGSVHTQSTDRAVGALGKFNLYGPNLDAYSPYLLFSRTHLSQFDAHKQRIVFGSADHNLRIDCSLTYPLNEWMRYNSATFIDYTYIYGWNLNRYTEWRAQFHLPFKQGQFSWLDWSKYDRSLEYDEIDEAFDYISQLYTPAARDRLRFSSYYYAHKTVIAPSETQGKGELFDVHGWGPSGSGFTHVINNFCNKRRMSYLLRMLDVDAKIWCAQDDVVLAGYRLDRLTQDAVDRLCRAWPLSKLEVSGRISENPEHVEFLSYNMTGGRLVRDPFRLYLLAIYPERRTIFDPAESAGRLRGLQLSMGQSESWLGQAAEQIEAVYCSGRQMEPIAVATGPFHPLFDF
jgi:hypothetical protein